jgi:hypothetical protein
LGFTFCIWSYASSCVFFSYFSDKFLSFLPGLA